MSHYPVTVTIVEEVVDATIYYTTDGTDPTRDSEIYLGEFVVNAPVTEIRSFATHPAYRDSDIALHDLDVGPPPPSPVAEGEMIAPVSKRSEPHIYAYLVDTGAVVKIDTSPATPKIVDYLVVNDAPGTYTLDYLDPQFGTTRGAYAISKTDYNKIWYLFNDASNGDLKLVEVDITTYPMTIIETSIHEGILDFGAGEFLRDGCAVDEFCFFPTSLLSGRILRFDDSHVLLDETFGYPTGGVNEAIASIMINPSLDEVFWMRNTDPAGVLLVRALFSLVVVWSFDQKDGGADSALWQNFLRYDELWDYSIRQRIYWPANGIAYYHSGWEMDTPRNWIQGLQYMKQYLGGDSSYFYVIHEDNSNTISYLHRFDVQTSVSAPLPQISVEVTAYAQEYAKKSYNSVYNDSSDKSCMLRFNSVDGLNYIATFNSSLAEVGNSVLDIVYWGD